VDRGWSVVRVLAHSLRHAQPRRQAGFARCQTRYCSPCQRFGSSLQLNVHLHTLVLDGVSVPASAPRPASTSRPRGRFTVRWTCSSGQRELGPSPALPDSRNIDFEPREPCRPRLASGVASQPSTHSALIAPPLVAEAFLQLPFFAADESIHHGEVQCGNDQRRWRSEQ
jgi:hypothetical protein